MRPTTLVVGSSIAGVRSAQALRSAGYDGRVVLVGEETELPYDKPPLSKGLLVGTQQAQDINLLSRDAAATAGIDLLLGHAAVRLDVARSRVELADGNVLAYDDLVVATGARPRPSPWTCSSGVHVLRTMRDAEALREDLQRGGPVVVVGGGFIGAEVASAARKLGLEVTIVDPVPVPMSRILGRDIGEHFLELHRRNGVRTRLGTGVEAIAGSRGALTVTLTDGVRLQAATVVVGIGASPNDEWLESSGLLIEDGVVCDQYGRAQGGARVYAVGDVARWYHPRRDELVRVEHWTNATEQALVVAQNIVFPEAPRSHDPVEYVWSDQHDWKIQVAGRTSGAREPAVVGRLPDRFAALYTDDGGHLIGAVTVNWPRAAVTCRRALLQAQAPFADVRAQLENDPAVSRTSPA
jgi:NADPH-dependent 2,4-dienoyl-CoA reductase/sulfur reductase-like enzyme